MIRVFQMNVAIHIVTATYYVMVVLESFTMESLDRIIDAPCQRNMTISLSDMNGTTLLVG